ncbi:hypothetical protein WJX72_000005 [[Myrmecia] bisecta]|uniref:Sugar phosphate transporter domain-containing protein n=1 Tax=[Myrmecia] bisecta TaxID=41462 RepID=A0AAW1PC35_9CHLO
MATKHSVIREVVRSYAYTLLWAGLSIGIILFNKWLLAYSGFHYPLALTAWHQLFCATIAVICIRGFGLVKRHHITSRDYFSRILPIGVLYAASLWLSNSSYLYLSVSFIQMTKSLMPGLVYAAGVLLGTEKFAWAVTANMALIAFGVLVCALGEVNLVVKGVVHQLAALCFEAARLALVQVLINAKGYNMNPLQSLYYISPACLLCLTVPFLLTELGPLMADTTLHIYPSVFLANALAAFALNLAVFLLIGKTSALTMNIAGVIKDWMLIFFSYYLFHAPVTAINLLGYAFCCTGVAIYQYMKLQMIKAKNRLTNNKDLEKTGADVLAAADGEQQELKPYSSGGFSSKADILQEIRRLQHEMVSLEGRIGTSKGT